MSKTTNAHVRAPFLTRMSRPEGLPESYLLVREAQATKLGLRAHGNIAYQVLLDPDRQRVFLRVVANSGSGSFSDEPVHLEKLVRAVANRDPNKPLRGSALQSAIVGKSACNAGFMAAVLVTEGLLGRDPAKRFDLLNLERWEAWSADQVAAPGQLTAVSLTAEGAGTNNGRAAARRKGKGTSIEPEPVTAVDHDQDGADEASPTNENGDSQADVMAAATAQAAIATDHEADHAQEATPKGRRRGKGRE